MPSVRTEHGQHTQHANVLDPQKDSTYHLEGVLHSLSVNFGSRQVVHQTLAAQVCVDDKIDQ